MKIKIGIGITTYNRAKCLEQMLLSNLSALKDKLVIISDDGSTDSTQTVLNNFNYAWITGANIGVAGSKNRLFRLLKDCDYIFMSDDDVLMSCGFEELYLKACLKTGIQHFTYSPPGKRWGSVLKETVYDNIVIQHTKRDGGAFSFYTKKVLEICGIYDSWSHRDYSNKIWQHGLAGKAKINHIKGSELLIKLMDVLSSVPKEDRRKLFKRFDAFYEKD